MHDEMIQRNTLKIFIFFGIYLTQKTYMDRFKRFEKSRIHPIFMKSVSKKMGLNKKLSFLRKWYTRLRKTYVFIWLESNNHIHLFYHNFSTLFTAPFLLLKTKFYMFRVEGVLYIIPSSLLHCCSFLQTKNTIDSEMKKKCVFIIYQEYLQ